MPYLNIKISSPNAYQVKDKVALLLTELTANVLGKKKELTAITVEPFESNLWFIGGTALDENGLSSFYLDIKITEGTNTKKEKAEYVQKVFVGMEDIVGQVASASYIVIHEVRADAWGYQGESQEYRYIKGKLL